MLTLLALLCLLREQKGQRRQVYSRGSRSSWSSWSSWSAWLGALYERHARCLISMREALRSRDTCLCRGTVLGSRRRQTRITLGGRGVLSRNVCERLHEVGESWRWRCFVTVAKRCQRVRGRASRWCC